MAARVPAEAALVDIITDTDALMDDEYFVRLLTIIGICHLENHDHRYEVEHQSQEESVFLGLRAWSLQRGYPRAKGMAAALASTSPSFHGCRAC